MSSGVQNSEQQRSNDQVCFSVPFARFNLYRNPFGELTREERIELALVDVSAIRNWLSGPRRAVQLVGDCGRGKTTRMLKVSQQFPDSVYVYLPEDEPCPPIPVGSPLLIDEAQRLPRKVRGDVFRSGLPLLLGTHCDLSRALGRHGYEVSTNSIGQENSAALVHQIMNRRIEASRLSCGAVPALSLCDAEWLVAKFGSDVRAMEGYLYEKMQVQVVQHGEMRFVD